MHIAVLLQVAESRHLKALVSMAGPDVICVGAGKAAQEVLKVRGKLQLCIWFSTSVGMFFTLLFFAAHRTRGHFQLPDSDSTRRHSSQCPICKRNSHPSFSWWNSRILQGEGPVVMCVSKNKCEYVKACHKINVSGLIKYFICLEVQRANLCK